jgi:hypothetical protein
LTRGGIGETDHPTTLTGFGTNPIVLVDSTIPQEMIRNKALKGKHARFLTDNEFFTLWAHTWGKEK